MFNLRTHPFAVDAFFDHSLVLTYALPVATLQPVIPDCLALDSWNENGDLLQLPLYQPAIYGRLAFLPGWDEISFLRVIAFLCGIQMCGDEGCADCI